MIEILLEAERNLSYGRLDQAEHLYRQAVEADPRNSIAVVGMARVALERGEDGRALELAERALAIDPENDAARRMVGRLREVRRYRAEPDAPEAAPEPEPAPDEAAEAEPAPKPEPDSAAPEPVSAAPGPDSASPGPDSASPGPDSASPGPDSAAPEPQPRPQAEPTRRGGLLGWLRRLFRRR